MNPASASSKALIEIANILDKVTEVGNPNDYLGTEKCSAEACAHCTSNCTSRTK